MRLKLKCLKEIQSPLNNNYNYSKMTKFMIENSKLLVKIN